MSSDREATNALPHSSGKSQIRNARFAGNSKSETRNPKEIPKKGKKKIPNGQSVPAPAGLPFESFFFGF
jgi:hypothetical protein